MKRKLMSLLLCAAMVLTSAAMLASCAEPTDTTTAPPSNINTPEESMKKIPDGLNFHDLNDEEKILTVVYTEGGNGTYTRRSLKADELDEADVDVATRARDALLKEKFGLELDIVSSGDGLSTMTDYVKTSLAAGNGDYDILAGYQYFAISLAADGYLLNLADLANPNINADYIDLEASYWGRAFNDNMSYKGGYYWITGDLALRYIGGMYCTFVNATTYNEKLSDYGSIYTIAKDGKWTVDVLTEMASKCYEDTGDTPGKADAADQFGFGWEQSDTVDGLAMGLGAQFTYKDPATGDITVTFNNARTFDISKKIKALANTSNFSFKFEMKDSAVVMPAFASGTVAFTINKLFQAETYLSEMEDDYYILPVPKYNEEQTSYITSVHDGCTVFGIPYDCQKVAQAAVALEFLCAYSSENVTPLYFEGALKGRYTRDPEAASMIDLIHGSVTTDFAVAWGNSIKSIGQTFRPCEVLNASIIGRRISEYTTALNELTGKLIQYVHGGEDAE